jgi:hypothetical protein
MIRTLTVIGLIVAIWLPLMDVAVFRKKRRALGDAARWRGLEFLTYVVFFGAVLLMALSSFGMILVGQHMHRWMLILHMSVAPVFAIAITLLAFLWAEQASFAPREHARERFYLGEKAAFWLIVVTAFLTITSAMVGMMTWFGTVGQDFLLNLHRYSSLTMLVTSVFLACRLWFGRSSLSPATA